MIVAVVFVFGCGSSRQDDSNSRVHEADVSAPAPKASVPATKAVEACFKAAGATSVYHRKEDGVILVDGLVGTNGIVSVELTGGQAKSEEAIARLASGNVSGLQSFEALDGAVVGVYTKGKPAGKRFILRCLE